MIDVQKINDISSGNACMYLAKGEHSRGDFALVVLAEFDKMIDIDGVSTGWFRWVPQKDYDGVWMPNLYTARKEARGAFLATYYDITTHGSTDIPASWQYDYNAISTATSGYFLQPLPDTPDGPCCGAVAVGRECECVEPPEDEALYIRMFHDGAFDDGLVGFAERDFMTGYERLMEAPHE